MQLTGLMKDSRLPLLSTMKLDVEEVNHSFGELHGNWLLIGGDETKQRIDKELSLNAINLEAVN